MSDAVYMVGSSEVAHIQSMLRYFPHGGSGTIEICPEYGKMITIQIQRNRDSWRIACLNCFQSVNLPRGYDWGVAWKLHCGTRTNGRVEFTPK